MSLIIYCNSCFKIQQEIKRKFFITSCSHVFCESCQLNLKNFCKICNTHCKILEINKQLPADVKMFFDLKSVERMAKNIQNIRNFQENQVKFYYEHAKPYVNEYQKMKTDVLKLHSEKKKYIEVIRKENQEIERFKRAYNTKNITPELFNLSKEELSVDRQLIKSMSGSGTNVSRSPLDFSMSHSINPSKTKNRSVNPLDRNPNDPVSSPGPTSMATAGSSRIVSPMGYSPRPPVLNISQQDNYSKQFSVNLSLPKLNLKRKTPSPCSSHSSTSSPSQRNMFQATHKSLLENTLRQMQTASQMKFQATRKKQFKM